MSKFDVAKPPAPTSSRNESGVILEAEEHVLATLEKDGSRRWLYPRLATGKLWQARRIIAYLLIAVFVLVPHFRVGGKPAVLLDLASRKFHIFGLTFLPTDTFLLALFLISALVSILLLTAVVGRVWCGWACPQTVFMEFVFRPIDRLFYGTKGRGGVPKSKLPLWKGALRFLVYLVLAALLAHTFLAYFIGTERLAVWVRQSPWEHPKPFLIMLVATAAMMFDAIYFREQLCLIACPYGRFQSVMLDRQSLIVAYDHRRGEPRGKGKSLPVVETKLGDCVDCGMCVQVCPTGIDIRNGLQMECINCTQCIDACNAVMSKLQRPLGLIRYASQAGIEGKSKSILRPRLLVYPLVLTAVFGLFLTLLANRMNFDAKLFRNRGQLFYVNELKDIENSVRLDLVNRTDQKREYQLRVISPDNVQLKLVESDRLGLAGSQSHIFPLLLTAPYGVFRDGTCEVELELRDDLGEHVILKHQMIGPESPPR